MEQATRGGRASAGFPYAREVVAADAALRADIATSRALGVSLRRFLGWEPRTITTTRDDGRTVTVREPEFDDWERTIQAAYTDWERGLCRDCGHPLAESLWDPDAEVHPQYRAGFRQCRACEVLEIAAHTQGDLDQRQSKQNRFPVATHHRHWFVERLDDTDTQGGGCG